MMSCISDQRSRLCQRLRRRHQAVTRVFPVGHCAYVSCADPSETVRCVSSYAHNPSRAVTASLQQWSNEERKSSQREWKLDGATPGTEYGFSDDGRNVHQATPVILSQRCGCRAMILDRLGRLARGGSSTTKRPRAAAYRRKQDWDVMVRFILNDSAS